MKEIRSKIACFSSSESFPRFTARDVDVSTCWIPLGKRRLVALDGHDLEAVPCEDFGDAGAHGPQTNDPDLGELARHDLLLCRNRPEQRPERYGVRVTPRPRSSHLAPRRWGTWGPRGTRSTRRARSECQPRSGRPTRNAGSSCVFHSPRRPPGGPRGLRPRSIGFVHHAPRHRPLLRGLLRTPQRSPADGDALILVKSDGSVSIHADDRAYKPLNWMSPPCRTVAGRRRVRGRARGR